MQKRVKQQQPHNIYLSIISAGLLYLFRHCAIEIEKTTTDQYMKRNAYANENVKQKEYQPNRIKRNKRIYRRTTPNGMKSSY